MSSQAMLKSDDFFKKLMENSVETRRWLVGKYSAKGNYNIDLTKSIPIYKGQDICHQEFNFTIEGTRCPWCNSLCLLTKNGNFNNGDVILIKSGSYRGQEITVYKYPIPEKEFGTYETVQFQNRSHMNVIRNTYKRQWLQNRSDNISHDIAISSILNSYNYPFKSRTLGAWICKDVNLVKLVPSLGSFKTAIFTQDLFKNTFFQLFMLSMIGSFSHGDPNANVLFLSNINSSFEIGSRKIPLSSTLFMDLSEYSSFAYDYDGRYLYFVGKEHDFNVSEPNYNLEFTMTTNNVTPKQHTKSPCKTSYLKSRMVTFIPSIEVMNYIRKTGINVFPHMYFVIYMTIALLNRTFYDIYKNSNAKTIYMSIFVNDDYERYISLIELHLGETPTCDEIITMLQSNNIHIRDDSLDHIKNNMVVFISN